MPSRVRVEKIGEEHSSEMGVGRCLVLEYNLVEQVNVMRGLMETLSVTVHFPSAPRRRHRG